MSKVSIFPSDTEAVNMISLGISTCYKFSLYSRLNYKTEGCKVWVGNQMKIYVL